MDFSPPLWWHQDWWCWDHPLTYRRMAPQIAVLCYLADTNAQNGALRVLRGSHLKSAPIHAVLPEAHGHSAEGLEPGHIALSDLPGQVTLCLRAGDAVVIDYRLLHTATVRLSPSLSCMAVFVLTIRSRAGTTVKYITEFMIGAPPPWQNGSSK